MTTVATAPTVDRGGISERVVPERIPFTRILGVELRKMFDTRAGFWLMASIVILSVLATTATIIFAPDSELTYEAFASAVGFPMTVVLPIIAILAVSGEWGQRTALTTFTLVPGRGRVITAKLVNTVVIGAVSIALAAAVGAVGNVVGTTIAGVDTDWNLNAGELSRIVLGNEIGMLMGFMLGVLLRSTPGAIVGYFVYALVVPVISTALMNVNDWYYDNVGWLDLNFAAAQLFNDYMTAQEWAQLGVTSIPWLIVPLAIGLRIVTRAEVK